jgi:long-chain acyl-CoA synthetase
MKLMKLAFLGIALQTLASAACTTEYHLHIQYTIYARDTDKALALNNHPDFAKLKLKRLFCTVAGGMALQVAVARKWKELTGTPIIEGYGLTEASPVVSCNPLSDAARDGTIGLPVPSTDVRIIKEDGTEAKPGEDGEICVKGPQVMQGYWNQAEETAKMFTADGWLKTGDVARQEEGGFFRIVDRKKDMILVSGFNVFPNEVESVIMDCSGVAAVAAVGVPDDKSGEVVKVFVIKKDPGLTAEQVIAHCRTQLTSYKVPKHVEFRQELPKNNVGKILRRMLRE